MFKKIFKTDIDNSFIISLNLSVLYFSFLIYLQPINVNENLIWEEIVLWIDEFKIIFLFIY